SVLKYYSNRVSSVNDVLRLANDAEVSTVKDQILVEHAQGTKNLNELRAYAQAAYYNSTREQILLMATR
ncbi:MAG: hypothetical protein WA705_21925, partial [Candidatus Ozemobacteraceae bacterium]